MRDIIKNEGGIVMEKLGFLEVKDTGESWKEGVMVGRVQGFATNLD